LQLTAQGWAGSRSDSPCRRAGEADWVRGRPVAQCATPIPRLTKAARAALHGRGDRQPQSQPAGAETGRRTTARDRGERRSRRRAPEAPPCREDDERGQCHPEQGHGPGQLAPSGSAGGVERQPLPHAPTTARSALATVDEGRPPTAAAATRTPQRAAEERTPLSRARAGRTWARSSGTGVRWWKSRPIQGPKPGGVADVHSAPLGQI
jgi:hypothetical protein